MQVLFVSVGGSPKPIVTAVQSLQPDRVVFVCSKGSAPQVIGDGEPCEVRQGDKVIERLPNLPTQLNLDERFNRARDLVMLTDEDDLAVCYEHIADKAREIQGEFPAAQLKADYTGGTKTMSVALVLVGLDYQFTLHVTTAKRRDIIKITRGELTSAVGLSSLIVHRFLQKSLPELLQTYNYAAALDELKRLLVSGVEARERDTLRQLSTLCAAFNAWDRFDHVAAWELLEPYMQNPKINSNGIFLRFVIGARAQLDERFSGEGGKRGHGYELIEDLLLNAERRAAQARYDDAVGRVYRALELLAQVRLKTGYDLETGDVGLEQLPEGWRSRYEVRQGGERKRIVFGLVESYELLAELGDPLGQRYRERASALKGALNVRNYSLFAHGFEPVTERNYGAFKDAVVPFIEEGIKTCSTKNVRRAPQFPIAL